MEQNNQTDAENNNEVVAQQAQPAQEAALQTPVRRRNGRNRSSASSAKSKSSSGNASCGEIEDMSCTSEKLSGSNVNGYTPRRQKAAEDAAEEKPEDSANTPEVQPEAQEQCQCGCEKVHEGPSFEQKGFTPRTIEVSLEDRRPKARHDRSEDGVVSYSTADEASCKVSVFARIKAALKSLFGGKKRKSFDKRGKKFDKNFKRDFKGKKRYPNNNNKNFNRDRNFHRRRPNNSNRPRNAGEQK